LIDLVVIHSISLPPGCYGGPEIEQLFTNQLDWNAHPYFKTIAGLKVSSHFVVRRNGQTDQYVSVLERAWHAGASSWRGRDNCNDDSVGIEMEGLEGDAFEPTQYKALAQLLRSLHHILPIVYVAGHEHIAPGRKCDPGTGFDWAQMQSSVADLPLTWP
jgi:AmpD protein